MLAPPLLLLAAAGSAIAADAAGLEVSCEHKSGCAITVDGALWSHSPTTKTRAGGRWCSSDDGLLEPTAQRAIEGSDGMGSYSGTALSWRCGGVPYETAVRVYSSAEGDAAIFSQRWPEGASGTALGEPKVPGPGGVQEQVLSAFPSIAPPAQDLDQSYAVVWNQMVGGMADGTKYGAWGPATAAAGVASGTMAGPMVFWSPPGSAAGASGLVLAPVTHAMEMNLFWSNASKSLEAGLLGSIREIPANYTAETLLFLGPDARSACAPRPCGPNAAVHGFGVALRRYKGKDTGFPAGGWGADATLSHLGYYSDNGAYCAPHLTQPLLLSTNRSHHS